MTPNSPRSRKDNLVVQELDGEVMIYDLTDNKAFCLNETSAIVWQACDGKNTPTEISKILSDKLNSPANEDFVWFALEQLKKEKLIENSNELQTPFLGMSRREVIKKVGLGSMIALPIVASLVAPSAAFAQSCNGATNNGGTCVVDTDCMSCCCDTVALPTMTCLAFMTLANGNSSNVACACLNSFNAGNMMCVAS